MKRLSIHLFAPFVVVVVGATVHCETKERPAAFDQTTPVSTSTEDPSFSDSDAGVLFNCGRVAESGTCSCVDVPLLGERPNLYFVLDRSASMSVDDKWTTMRIVVGQTMRSIGGRANFGAAVFPGSAGECSTGVEIMKTTLGDSFHSVNEDGPTTKKILSSTAAISPTGGTPTAATLRVLGSSLKSLSGKTYVILLTDGGPNCNSSHGCGVSKCISNIESLFGCTPGDNTSETTGTPNCCKPPRGASTQCLDDDETAAAITELHDGGIATYVVGVPGSAPYAAALAKFATAGGTAVANLPYYYDVSTIDQAAFRTAIGKVAAAIVGTCDFPLETPPDHPDQLNVWVDDVVIPRDGINGWELSGPTLTLKGESCARVRSGEAIGVRILYGCPTLIQ